MKYDKVILVCGKTGRATPRFPLRTRIGSRRRAQVRSQGLHASPSAIAAMNISALRHERRIASRAGPYCIPSRRRTETSSTSFCSHCSFPAPNMRRGAGMYEPVRLSLCDLTAKPPAWTRNMFIPQIDVRMYGL